MKKPFKTKTGTIIAKGIEYNNYPPPKALVKIMKRCFALEIMQNGFFRLRKPIYYHMMENAKLGDPTDSIGMFYMNGHEYITDTSNPMFIWCMSFPTISKKHILDIALSEKYDCLLKINNPEKFFKRISEFLSSNKIQCLLHCGRVTYNRGKEVNKSTLNTQKFNFNIFQKPNGLREDKEYRLSLMDMTYSYNDVELLDLKIGPCLDIMEIADLP